MTLRKEINELEELKYEGLLLNGFSYMKLILDLCLYISYIFYPFMKFVDINSLNNRLEKECFTDNVTYNINVNNFMNR